MHFSLMYKKAEVQWGEGLEVELLGRDPGPFHLVTSPFFYHVTFFHMVQTFA